MVVRALLCGWQRQEATKKFEHKTHHCVRGRRVKQFFLKKTRPTKKMNTQMWGPSAWALGDGLFARFPERPTPAESCAAAGFVAAFGRALPCIYCRQSFFGFVRNSSAGPTLEEAAAGGRDALRKWWSLRHDDVNRKLNKPIWWESHDYLPKPPCGRELRRAADAFLLAIAYNLPHELPSDTKGEDFYRFWTDALVEMSRVCGDALGKEWADRVEKDEEALRRVIDTDREAVQKWATDHLASSQEGSMATCGQEAKRAVFGLCMPARKGGCSKTKAGCV